MLSDRYAYLSCLSWAILLGGGLAYSHDALRGNRFGGLAVFVPTGLVVALLGFLVWNQAKVWHDSERLLRYAVAVAPESRKARKNLADVLDAQGRDDDTMQVHFQAVKSRPKSVGAHVDLGQVLARHARVEEAMQSYRRAIQLDPSFGEAHLGIGDLLMKRGEYGAAMEPLPQGAGGQCSEGTRACESRQHSG
jgi:cytochrome c-type biogenesis protein CcmH/NrfG